MNIKKAFLDLSRYEEIKKHITRQTVKDQNIYEVMLENTKEIYGNNKKFKIVQDNIKNLTSKG